MTYLPLALVGLIVFFVIEIVYLERRDYRLQRIENRQENMMATLDEILETVSAESTKLDSVIALIDGLKAQLADAMSGVTLPPPVQAKVDAIFEAAKTNAGKVADALDENVEPPPAEG